MTAGELIRRELDAGTSQLALAKRLADSNDDADVEVKRWRHVVLRAARGAEPDAANVKRIAEVFRQKPEDLAGRRQRRAIVEDHLEELRKNDDELLAMMERGLRTQEELRDELQSIREALDTLAAGARIRPTQSQVSQ